MKLVIYENKYGCVFLKCFFVQFLFRARKSMIGSFSVATPLVLATRHCVATELHVC